jgi:NAD(P)-dependent dehydrogenase (short-subunit alcohol dehydrogenase family)
VTLIVELRNLFDLSGRVAIVTGASSGLGDRFARVLHAAGASVVAVARRADRLAALAEKHERICAIAGDVTDDTAMRNMVATTAERFGRIDVVVNNAGAGNPIPAVSEPLESFRATVELNLTAVFNLARLAAPHMSAAGAGSIINIASILGLGSAWPLPNASYTSAKGAVIQLTRELACQWAKSGVRVNAIAPGYFLTEATAEAGTDAKLRDVLLRKTPMRRFGEEHELDGALLLLAGDAGSFITGQTLVVDGGWTAH